MKKSFILLALTVYFVIGAYSVTRTKNAAFSAANAPAEDSPAANDFKLATNQPEAIKQFYRTAFGAVWQASENGYEGQVLNAHIQLLETRNKKPRRLTIPLEVVAFEGLVERILDAGGNLQARGNGKTKSYLLNDPDGNLIVLKQRNP